MEPRGEGSTAAWLHGIAANVTGHWRRERYAERRATSRLAIRERGVTEDPSSDIIERADATRFRERFSRASKLLTNDQRQALAMRVLDDASYEDIASATGATTATARARVSRGLRTFALVAGVAVFVLLMAGVATAAVSAVADLLWDREQPVVVPTAQEVADWPTIPIVGAKTTQGALFSVKIGDVPLGGSRPGAGGRGRILHPSVGTYIVEIPMTSATRNVIPSVDLQIYDRSTRADLMLPDPETGARLGFADDPYDVTQGDGPGVFRMPIRVRSYGPVGDDGMQCLRGRYAEQVAGPMPAMTSRAAIHAALDECRMIPGVMPELDIEETKRMGDEDMLSFKRNAGVPVDVTSDMELAVNISILEIISLTTP